jgi:hypothetical protein
MLRGHVHTPLRCEVASDRIGAIKVVGLTLRRREVVINSRVAPMVLLQPFVSHRPIEPWGIFRLMRVARLGVFHYVAERRKPVQNRRFDVFRVVVGV